MLLLQGHVSLLATFTTAEGLSVLLPKAMERLRLPSVLGVIVGGPTGLGVVLPNGPIITLLAEIGKLLMFSSISRSISMNLTRRLESLEFGPKQKQP